MPASLPYDEKALLLRLSEGDERAFELIYNFYQPKLFLYIYPFAGQSREDTEEVLQDIFVKLWIRKEVLPAIESFHGYLFTMAKNRLLDMQQKRTKVVAAINRKQPAGNNLRSPILENITFTEYTAIAKKGIESLSRQRKTIFLLRYEMDLSLDEIAATLKIAKTTTKNQLYEAVKQVKKFIGEHGAWPIPFLLLVDSLTC